MYGRARRLDFYKTILIVVVILLVVYAVIRLVINIIPKKDTTEEFYNLKKYMVDSGYVCENLKASGGTCKITKDNLLERFTRYDDGFEYIYNNGKYMINIYHVKNVERFVFTTSDTAFTGYKNKEYSCTYKDNIIGELDTCTLVDNKYAKLDNEAYISVIAKPMVELNKVIMASGYNKDTLINEYKWVKK